MKRYAQLWPAAALLGFVLGGVWIFNSDLCPHVGYDQHGMPALVWTWSENMDMNHEYDKKRLPEDAAREANELAEMMQPHGDEPVLHVGDLVWAYGQPYRIVQKPGKRTVMMQRLRDQPQR